jgi:hypothetical protein
MVRFRLPYFDGLFAELANSNSSIEKRFGRHVHWGYWPDPQKRSAMMTTTSRARPSS